MAVALRPVLAGLGGCLILSLIAACHNLPSRVAGATPEQPAGESGQSSGVCTFDLSDDKEQTVFFLLGFLEEYLGRRIVEGDDRVEGFYASEADKAALFRQYLVRLANQQGFDTIIVDEKVGKGLVFRSKPLADGLNSCYRYQLTSGTMAPGPDGRYRRTAAASLGRALFLRSGHGAGRGNGLPDEVFRRRRALAYVAGAWVRYGRDQDFVFANAHEKAALLAQLLVDLGCRKVSLETIYGFIPQTNYVHFLPTEEVKEWLSRSW